MNSKYNYVRLFEQEMLLMQKTYIIIRVDGKNFKKFTKAHDFEKPNDMRGINAMNSAAEFCMKEFTDIKIAYGQSDEYSFMFEPSKNPCQRRTQKLVSLIASTFTSHYVMNGSWKYPPSFDARAVLYPQKIQMMDYFRWRQVDCHINNLYNICFWNLVKDGMSTKESMETLKNTLSSDKNEILFSKFKINYNNEPEVFRKGTTIIRSKTSPSLNISSLTSKSLYIYHGDLIKDSFWEEVEIE